MAGLVVNLSVTLYNEFHKDFSWSPGSFPFQDPSDPALGLISTQELFIIGTKFNYSKLSWPSTIAAVCGSVRQCCDVYVHHGVLITVFSGCMLCFLSWYIFISYQALL